MCVCINNTCVCVCVFNSSYHVVWWSVQAWPGLLHSMWSECHRSGCKQTVYPHGARLPSGWPERSAAAYQSGLNKVHANFTAVQQSTEKKKKKKKVLCSSVCDPLKKDKAGLFCCVFFFLLIVNKSQDKTRTNNKWVCLIKIPDFLFRLWLSALRPIGSYWGHTHLNAAAGVCVNSPWSKLQCVC